MSRGTIRGLSMLNHLDVSRFHRLLSDPMLHSAHPKFGDTETLWMLPRSVTSAKLLCSTTTRSPSCTSSSTTAWKLRCTSALCAPAAPRCAGTESLLCVTGPSVIRPSTALAGEGVVGRNGSCVAFWVGRLRALGHFLPYVSR